MTVKEDQVQKITLVPRSLVEKFDNLYPQRGAWTWAITTFMTHFISLHEITPEEMIELAAQQTLEEITTESE